MRCAFDPIKTRKENPVHSHKVPRTPRTWTPPAPVVCPGCRRTFPPTQRQGGRPRIFCGERCSNRVHQRRHRARLQRAELLQGEEFRNALDARENWLNEQSDPDVRSYLRYVLMERELSPDSHGESADRLRAHAQRRVREAEDRLTARGLRVVVEWATVAEP